MAGEPAQRIAGPAEILLPDGENFRAVAMRNLSICKYKILFFVRRQKIPLRGQKKVFPEYGVAPDGYIQDGYFHGRFLARITP